MKKKMRIKLKPPSPILTVWYIILMLAMLVCPAGIWPLMLFTLVLEWLWNGPLKTHGITWTVKESVPVKKEKKSLSPLLTAWYIILMLAMLVSPAAIWPLMFFTLVLEWLWNGPLKTHGITWTVKEKK